MPKTRTEVPSGLVIVDKPAGITSHDVVARVRRLAGTRKVGHAGTLDPMATGVLVLGVERATRLLGHLMLTEKAYDATVRLGQTSTTDDAEGELGEPVDASHLTEEAVRAAFAAQVGDLLQVPTAVSAIKVDGKRAYARVRAGEEVELKARPVTVHELVVRRVGGPPGYSGTETPISSADPGAFVPDYPVVDIDISLRCSSGTYVRAIARDVGAALGVGGHLTALRRTAVGPYGVDAAQTLEQLADRFESSAENAVLPIADAARAAFPSLELSEEQAADVRVGRRLPLDLTGITAVFAPDGEFLALYEPVGDPGHPAAKPTAVFVG